MKEKLVMRTVLSAAWCTVLSIAVVVLAARKPEAPPQVVVRVDTPASAATAPAVAAPPIAGDASTALAKDLWRLDKEKGNVVFSPYGTARALELLKAGASGKMREGLERLLHGGTARLDARGIVESRHLWGQVGIPFKKEFNVDLVDFGKTEMARKTMNDRVAAETHGAIPQIVEAGRLNERTKLTITDALSMKAEWQKAFEKSHTRPGWFRSAADTECTVTFMNEDLPKARWGRSESVGAIELPYGHWVSEPEPTFPQLASGWCEPTGVVMDVIMPRDMDEYTLDLGGALALMTNAGANLWLPRFELRSEQHLLPSLRSLGLETKGDVDYSGFAGLNLAVDDITTTSWVKVDEEGTEAGSATVATIKDSIGFELPHPTFRIDHAFYFVVRDTNTGSVFFTGRVRRPDVTR